MKTSATLLTLWATTSTLVQAQTMDMTAFTALTEKMEQDILELREAAEAAYMNQCQNSHEWKNTCARSNYDMCGSSFPNPACLQSVDEEDTFYGRGDVCLSSTDTNSSSACQGSMWDFTISAVRLPNSKEDVSVEGICTSQALDEFFVAKRDADREFWMEQGMEDTPWMYFGADDGHLRMYPARPDENCGSDERKLQEEDMRERPWYAVSNPSGPGPNKNVVLLLDNSGSMTGMAIDNLKNAALEIVDELYDGDTLAIMPFNDDSVTHGFNTVLEVNKENKKLIMTQLNDMEVGGATNMYGAFTDVFKVLDTAVKQKQLVDAPCPTATDVVFLTDFRMHYPDRSIDGFLDYFQRRFDQMKSDLSMPLVNLFWVDVSDVDESDRAFRNAGPYPQQSVYAMRKNTGWEEVAPNSFRAAMQTPIDYVRTFSSAKPLQIETYDDHTAWVKPYYFDTNGVMGASVSTPVYDRSVDPPRFVGVVGMDVPTSILQMALGGASDESLEDLLEYSSVLCPIQMTVEEQFQAIESLAKNDTNSEIDVGLNVGRSAGFTTDQCAKELPTDIFANDGEMDSFSKRACCASSSAMEGICEQDSAAPTGSPTQAPVADGDATTTATGGASVGSEAEDSSSDTNLALILGICGVVVVVIGILAGVYASANHKAKLNADHVADGEGSGEDDDFSNEEEGGAPANMDVEASFSNEEGGAPANLEASFSNEQGGVVPAGLDV